MSRESGVETRDSAQLRPARVCGQLLAALDASEGRRRRRKRNTTPDAIGMAIKRRLLELTVRDDPEPGDFEDWLCERCLSWGETDVGSGPVRAMALTILDEWRLAQSSAAFRSWLDAGAPSADAVQLDHQATDQSGREIEKTG